jgi:hypothetical protein
VTPEEKRRELVDFHTTFSTPEGRRVLDALRRDLHDRPAHIAKDARGVPQLLDDRTTLARCAESMGYWRIVEYLDAYEAMARKEDGRRQKL